MNFGYSDDELQTVDKLRDDTTFQIMTVSGKDHTVSINSLAALLQSVVDKWLKINKE